MKKKILFITIGAAIAVGSIWYILNGGTETTNEGTEEVSTSQGETVTEKVEKDTLTDILTKQKDLKIFNELIVSAGLAESLQAVGPYTVLAPTDDAFKALPDGVLETLQKPENKTMLSEIINYHIVKGKLAVADLQNAQKLPTVNGQEVIVEVKDSETRFIDAKGGFAGIENGDISASNGEIHMIDSVLLPQ